MITKKHIDALVASKLDLLKSSELFKNNIANIQKEIREELESLAGLAAPEVCVDRCNFFNLKGTTPDDYRERILELNDNKFLLAGIRFQGLDVTKPFVSVQASFTDLNENIVSEISDSVLKDFSMFKPQSVHLTLPSDFKISMPTMQIDRNTVVGVVDDLIERELTGIPDSIELVALADMEFYDEYLKEYALFHTRTPALSSVVKAESVDDFKEAIQDKLLYKIIINGSTAGLIAGLASDYYGLKGVNILEEILFDSFKGKGFGVYIQRAFTLKLKDRYSVLWGTISDLNVPSLKTALKNGRQVTEIEYVFKIESSSHLFKSFMLTKKFPLIGESNQEIGAVTLEHLWSDVYGIRIFRTETYANPNQWARAISDALNESVTIKAREVMFRLIKDEYSIELSELLPNLGFKKKNERVEFTRQIDLLPDNSGSPIVWKTAEQLKWSEQEIANTLDLVAVGDPGHDPSEDSASFIQDFLSDSVLTSGLSCIHIGFIEDEVAAFTVVQINPKSGWSRISYMGIVPKFRSKGLGKWVHRYSFSVMKAEGGKLYRGGTDSTNTAMINLFELHQCERACHMEEWVKAFCN